MKFDFNKFNWKEAVSGPDGKSSVGKMLAFWYGVALIVLTFAAGILYFVKEMDKGDIQNIFLFVGTQMPIVLGYLLGNKNLENKKENPQPGPIINVEQATVEGPK